MRTRTRILVGLFITFLVIAVVLVFLAYRLTTRSFPQVTGTIELPGIKNDVKVYRDQFGVPHIFAENVYDAYYAVGFIHAQDRLWQMDLIRRAGLGRLAEVLGEEALPIDRMFRTLRLSHLAKETLVGLDDEVRLSLDAYSDGISAFIKHNKGKYPLEFDILGYEPEPWKAEHSALISRLMAWELNYGRWIDLVQSFVAGEVGEEMARELYPSWPADAPMIIPKDRDGKRIAAMDFPLIRSDLLYRKIVGAGSYQGGSNAWAVSGERSVSGKPLLANDPHLLLNAPARWFELHVVAPGLDVYGASIPGIPYVIIGKNKYIAWGVTNAMIDDSDFYVEQVDSLSHPSFYRFNNQWKPMKQMVDTIIVKDALPVVVTNYYTHRGPIINKIEPVSSLYSELVSMRWTGFDVTKDPATFYLINRAANWSEFESGLKFFNAPAQNFVYADVEGNIGYKMGGRLPIRNSKGSTPLFPGSVDTYDWKGMVPFDQMPRLFNPRDGYIATANNKVIDDSYPYHVSTYWEPEWRIKRIVELLKSQPTFSVSDFEKMQFDIFSPQARELVPIILETMETEKLESKEALDVLSYLRNWTYEMRDDDVSTSFFHAFLYKTIQNTYADELGEQVMSLYDTLAMPPMTAITAHLKQNDSRWFDNVLTEPRETKADIIRKSFHDALGYLRENLGGELKEWRWGRIHQVEFEHMFGAIPLLRPLFNVGPFPNSGSYSSINNGYFRFDKPFKNSIGPSIRFIFDLADLHHPLAVMPPGQSGHPFHENYDDQVELWIHGSYRRVSTLRSTIEESCEKVLTLTPPK